MTILDVLNALVVCLGQSIKDAGLPDPCFLGVVPGGAAAQDYTGDCDDACGMAWVRLGTRYPSSGVGIQDTTPGNCSAERGFDIEVGIMRCLSVGDEDGNPPSPAELAEATALQIMDSEAIVQAIACCPALSKKDWMLGAYQPIGPEGGLVGGAWTAYMVPPP